MFCVNCGNEVNEGSKFCSNCGQAINNETTPNLNDVQNNTNNITNFKINENNNANINNLNINGNNNINTSNNFDTPSKGLSTGALLLPPLGIAYYFLSKKDFPNKAHGALEASIFGIVTYTVAALIFIFIILPIEKQYIIKYECEKSIPGSVYYDDTHTCKRPDGSEYKKFYK